MKRNLPFFPINESMRPAVPTEGVVGYLNEHLGGLSVRDYLITHYYGQLLANPAFIGSKIGLSGELITIETLCSMAVKAADLVLERIGEN